MRDCEGQEVMRPGGRSIKNGVTGRSASVLVPHQIGHPPVVYRPCQGQMTTSGRYQSVKMTGRTLHWRTGISSGWLLPGHRWYWPIGQFWPIGQIGPCPIGQPKFFCFLRAVVWARIFSIRITHPNLTYFISGRLRLSLA